MASEVLTLELNRRILRSWLHTHWNLEAEVNPLAGEVDQNFLVVEGRYKFLLKVSRPDADPNEIKFQQSIQEHLAPGFKYQIPETVSTNRGEAFTSEKDEQGRIRLIRLQSWVEGTPLAEFKPKSEMVLNSWGKLCGDLSQGLKDFDHPYAHRHYKWNPSLVLEMNEYVKLFSESRQKLAIHFLELFEREVQPRIDDLRKSVNYNDAHDQNLIVNKDGAITGLIDFGDALYCETINELAIACAYACMDLPDPLAAAAHMVKGYHQQFKLTEKELQVLFPLITARLILTVIHAAQNQLLEPENEYLQISSQPAWKLLKKLASVHPRLAYYRFREACDLEPCPARKIFDGWASRGTIEVHPVINFPKEDFTPLDLSIGSRQLGNNSNFENPVTFQTTIQNSLLDSGKKYGYGGYDEARPFYTTDNYKAIGNNGPKWRTTHLGLDLWCPEGTPVYAPLAGEIVYLKDNDGDRNYGPTIILRHEIYQDLVIYTLYGHLSWESLQGKRSGGRIQKGQAFAELGGASENGNWPPHLHFQIILDLMDWENDFPGVCFPGEKKTWLSICPDPALLFPEFTNLVAPQSQESLLAKRKEFLGPNLSISYEDPLKISRGFRQYLYNNSGQKYLDLVNNVAHVGHEHPEVVRAGQQQMAVLNTNTRYLHKNILQLAEKLTEKFPKPLSVVYFVNSGSEANELALRMIRTATGRKDVIAMSSGYHGNTAASIDVSSYKFEGKGGAGKPPTTHLLDLPDVFRGKYKDMKTAGEKYAAQIHDIISHLDSQGKAPAGLIAESILSCGGQIVPPPDYFERVYEAVKATGGYCIADEVQTGFGRVGEAYWAFELQQVVPDIVTLGKPFGNGHPIGAVICTPEVAKAFETGMEYFNTFGGNPVSCALGLSVMDVIEKEGLQVNALNMGELILHGLRSLKAEYPIIGDVRGHGLFLGFELVKNEERDPASIQASYLANRLRQRKILTSTDGPQHNVIKLKPPLCINQNDVEFFLNELESVLSENAMRI
ncbi:MAG: aminotransferase class III-fold pyridoxal phosphate-dependent enzyme [Saprospiraceae bacterium]|nr:aminotransferase class III-fold pyridoxal phosphate-dependent enzyme [Saprospiraceae bacterium]